MKLTNYLGDKPFWKVAARLALPIAVQNMLTTSFTLVDTMMVSQLGDVTLSSVGMAGQWGWLVTLLSFGLCSGMSVFVAQYWGVRDLKGIRRVMGMGIFSCLLLTLGFALVAACAPAFVIGLFNQDSAVLEAGSRYLRIVCISYPAVALSNVLSTVLRNTEQVKLPMYVSIFTTLANAVVNYGLIFGKLGMPELGVEGAAVATCISSWLGPVLLVVFSAFRKNLLIGPLKELFSFRWDNLRRFFQRALPVVINEGLWAGGTLILNMIYSNLGYEYYAGMAFASFVGLGNACVIMVGKSVGQGKIQRAVQDATRFTVLVPLVAAIMGLVVIACRNPLIALFAAGDNLSAVTLQTASSIIVFYGLEIAFRNVGYVQVVGVFRSGGDTLRGMIYDLGSLWVLGIPAALAAAFWLELPFVVVVACAFLGEDLPKTVLCLRHFKSLRWLMPVTPEGKKGLEEYKKQG